MSSRADLIALLRECLPKLRTLAGVLANGTGIDRVQSLYDRIDAALAPEAEGKTVRNEWIERWIEAENETINVLFQNANDDWLRAYVSGAAGVLSKLRKTLPVSKTIEGEVT